MKKMIFILMLALAYSFHAHAQSTQEDWKLLKDTSGVSFHYTISQCDGKDFVFLKIVNANNSQVTIQWSAWFYDPLPEIIIGAASSVIGDCSSQTLKIAVPAGVTPGAPAGFTITKLSL